MQLLGSADDWSRWWSERPPALKHAPCGRPCSRKWKKTVPLASPNAPPQDVRQGAGPATPSVPPRTMVFAHGCIWGSMGLDGASTGFCAKIGSEAKSGKNVHFQRIM